MSKILTVDPDEPEHATLTAAARILRQGGIVAFPTETFYGLAASIDRVDAVQRVFEIKGRDLSKPILILIGDQAALSSVTAEVPHHATRLMDRYWPGPLTLLFHASPDVPQVLTGKSGKIGVRISPHPVCRALIRHVGSPITGTSANLSGRPSCSRVADVAECMGGSVNLILDGGATPGGVGSTIVDVTENPPLLVRKGVVSFEGIRRLLLSGER
jgi:L-threonylcarbamoyladenylate synthase